MIPTVGKEKNYQSLTGTVRSEGNVADGPKTVNLAGEAGWQLTASLETAKVGRYDRTFSVSESHVFTVSHNVREGQGSLEIQRFVKAVRVTGDAYFKTCGGYLAWSESSKVPSETAIKALCEATIKSASWQDDGPHGNGKITDVGADKFTVRDSPGLASTSKAEFPYALLTEFVLRVRIKPSDEVIVLRPRGECVVEFPYSTYFEFLTDPYPEGMRDSMVVPRQAGRRDFKTFDQIASEFQAASQQTQTASQPAATVVRTLDDIRLPSQKTSKVKTQKFSAEW